MATKRDLKERARNLALAAGYVVLPAVEPQATRSVLELLKPRPSEWPLIRLGPEGDGGYLIPDDLDGVVGLLSPGVSDQVGFDRALADMGLPVLLCDASVSAPPQRHPRFKFIPKFLDVYESEETLTLEDAAAHLPQGDLIMQMDIEGAEHRVLLATPPKVLSRFRIIVLELHRMMDTYSSHHRDDARAFFRHLLQNHTIVHLHANNFTGQLRRREASTPEVVEITLIRNDRYSGLPTYPPQLPHELDVDCDPSRPGLDPWMYR